MPTYEYSCKECGTYGSVHRTYKEDDGGMRCPKCHIDIIQFFFKKLYLDIILYNIWTQIHTHLFYLIIYIAM